ncbi:hypothetical protein PHMEG_00017833 [Phytophthora megakarya]|uniref:Uncharacterized protein n=1 Tax=Phytophthora megakarya TaxID=4795 RepID=A0A225VVK8_9STRA|nr:hypothetical protein PHMEG_00017833 [Phytophthora megakarya]
MLEAPPFTIPLAGKDEEQSYVDFVLSPSARDDVVVGIKRSYRGGHTRGKALERIAYAWETDRLFYDSNEFPDLHLSHRRTWMMCRYVFYQWALHPPLPVGFQQNRRRRKNIAVEEPYKLTSFYIETWEGRNALFKREVKEGTSRVQDAQAAYRLDRHGLKTVTEYSDKTEALDANGDPGARLSDRALARVKLDTQRPLTVPSYWVGDLTSGVWLKLCECQRIKHLRVEVEQLLQAHTYEMPETPACDPAEFAPATYAPLKTTSGVYTALPPLTTVPERSDETGAMITVDSDEEKEKVEAGSEDQSGPRSRGKYSFLCSSK